MKHLDTSAYVEYSSSSDDAEKPQNRSKPVKRRKDESDSGSDVRDTYICALLRTQSIDCHFFYSNSYSCIHFIVQSIGFG